MIQRPGGHLKRHGGLADINYMKGPFIIIAMVDDNKPPIIGDEMCPWAGPAGEKDRSGRDGSIGQDDLSKVKLIGEDFRRHVVKYRLNANVDRQRKWIEDLRKAPASA